MEALIAASGGVAAVGVVALLLVFYAVSALPTSGVFHKAGWPWWAAFVPIYNTLILLRVVGRPLWWFFLFLIPIVNIVFVIIVMNDLSKSFGHETGFTVGLVLVSWIFLLLIWLGPSEYLGPAADPERFGLDGHPSPAAQLQMRTADIIYVTFFALVILFVLGAAAVIHTGFIIVVCLTSALIFGVFMAAGFLSSSQPGQSRR